MGSKKSGRVSKGRQIMARSVPEGMGCSRELSVTLSVTSVIEFVLVSTIYMSNSLARGLKNAPDELGATGNSFNGSGSGMVGTGITLATGVSNHNVTGGP